MILIGLTDLIFMILKILQKNQSDLSKATNVPLYFKLPDDNEGSIIITVPTENIGRSIINDIINENGGDISFRSAEHEE